MIPNPLAAFSIGRDGLRYILLALLALALFGTGFHFGGLGPKAKLAKLEAAATVQQVQNKHTEARGGQITKDVGAQYEQAYNHLASLLGSGRLQPDSGRSKAPKIPGSPDRPDARPADVGPSTGIRPPAAPQCTESDEYRALKADAAATTVEYLFLRDWLEQQIELHAETVE